MTACSPGPMADTNLPKSPTGILGLDEITGGGLPQGRPTLVCGSAGCGKTLLAVEFLVQGLVESTSQVRAPVKSRKPTSGRASRSRH